MIKLKINTIPIKVYSGSPDHRSLLCVWGSITEKWRTVSGPVALHRQAAEVWSGFLDLVPGQMTKQFYWWTTSVSDQHVSVKVWLWENCCRVQIKNLLLILVWFLSWRQLKCVTQRLQSFTPGCMINVFLWEELFKCNSLLNNQHLTVGMMVHYWSWEVCVWTCHSPQTHNWTHLPQHSHSSSGLRRKKHDLDLALKLNFELNITENLHDNRWEKWHIFL